MYRTFALSLMLSTFSVVLGCSGGIYFEATATTNAPIAAKTPLTIDGHTIDSATVHISDISVHTSNSAGADDAGWTSLNLQNVTALDLLSLEGSINNLLGTAGLASGTYQQIRIGITSATITIDGSSTAIDVTVPSDKVALHFTPPVTLAAGNLYGVLLRFNITSALSLHGSTWSLTINASTLTNTPYLIESDGSHTSISGV